MLISSVLAELAELLLSAPVELVLKELRELMELEEPDELGVLADWLVVWPSVLWVL